MNKQAKADRGAKTAVDGLFRGASPYLPALYSNLMLF
jgi:hypothetical protein